MELIKLQSDYRRPCSTSSYSIQILYLHVRTWLDSGHDWEEPVNRTCYSQLPWLAQLHCMVHGVWYSQSPRPTYIHIRIGTSHHVRHPCMIHIYYLLYFPWSGLRHGAPHRALYVYVYMHSVTIDWSWIWSDGRRGATWLTPVGALQLSQNVTYLEAKANQAPKTLMSLEMKASLAMTQTPPLR